ncbi:nitroreductase family protein [Curtobacterium sp. MCBD17_019]|uniref:nitroreductase family protein n=1 Tax=Curtobacterium sp. MCBD17_019 TaxID=2175669 RepID=UPI0015E8E973|nr:nitroreductase family protein [Curtobacterium sp. MCBD17_019]
MIDRISIVRDLRAEADAAAQDAAAARHPGERLQRAEQLRGAMRHRSAETHFAADPIPLAHVVAALDAMAAIDRTLWGDVAEDLPLRALVACRHVTDLQPGLLEHRGGRFRRIQTDGGALRMREMVLQPEFADAAAILLAVGDLEGMSRRFGAHGHRMLLSRGGAACEAAWLAAVSAGLTGSIFAGFLPSALRATAGIDGNRELQLLALAIGAPR